jgi:hypothetical protein
MQDHVWRPRRAAKYFINLRPVKAKPKRKRLSMRPEKRPQTIMEQYRYREMMSVEHNRKVLRQQELEFHRLLWDFDAKAWAELNNSKKARLAVSP